MARTFIGKQGYRLWANSKRPVHRTVARIKIGRPIRSNEVVHHRNENKLDNRRSNLRVMSRPAHYKLHKRKWR